MPTPTQGKPAEPRDLVAELLALQPYVEHILCDGSREPHERAAAKDRVQTVLRKAIQHLPSYQPHKEGLRPWVTRIARNEKVDAHRSSRRRDDTFGHDHIAADLAPSTTPSPEREVQAREFLERVWLVIEEMQPELQDVLVLSAFSEFSHAEIAAQLKISEDLAKMRLSRARRMLRKRTGSLRDHLGVWLLFVTRKLTAFRLPMFRFVWQVSHLLPPVFIGLVALPHFEPTVSVPTENILVALSGDASSPLAPDIEMTKRFVLDRSVYATTPPVPAVDNAHASDKPRQRTQAHHEFKVDLPAVTTFINDRR